MEDWIQSKEVSSDASDKPYIAAITDLDNEPFIAVCRVLEDKGFIIVGFNLRKDLDAVTHQSQTETALWNGGKLIYCSNPNLNPSKGLNGTTYLAGERYLASSGKMDTLDTAMFGSMMKLDEDRKTIVFQGAYGLVIAIAVAIIVSTLFARGISQPVEILVEATKKVGEGDYETKVNIRKRDELGKLGIAFNDMTENLKKRRDVMDKTLSRDVADELMKDVQLGGDRRVVTIMFMDVRGFTTATEGKDPGEVVEMLNELLDRLAKVIEKTGGVINKYLGDGIMAMWGAPRRTDFDAESSVWAALGMTEEVRRWNDDRKAKGLSTLQIGIGINTGIVLAGRVGSKTRLEYTLIGEAVNLSSRVCGKAQPGQILLTESTFNEVKNNFKTKELEAVRVKGLSYDVKLFEVVG